MYRMANLVNEAEAWGRFFLDADYLETLTLGELVHLYSGFINSLNPYETATLPLFGAQGIICENTDSTDAYILVDARDIKPRRW